MSKPSSGCAVSRRAAKATSRDWGIFSERLTSVLAKLKEDQYLIISAKNGNRYVQFACQGAWGMRAEVTSNHFLEGSDKLKRREMSWLRSHGWNAPTGSANKATPKRDPNGSPNYYIDFPAPLAVVEIAKVGVEALVHALEIRHPSSLVYQSFDDSHKMLCFEELGLKPATQQCKSLTENVLEVFREVTRIADLKPEDDGEIAIRYGEIVVRAFPLQSKVRLFSGLITDIEESPALLCKLNQLNIRQYGIRCVFHEKTVIAAFDLLANPFVPEHLAAEIREFAEVAEGLALELGVEFTDHSLVGTTTTPHYLQ